MHWLKLKDLGGFQLWKWPKPFPAWHSQKGETLQISNYQIAHPMMTLYIDNNRKIWSELA